MDTDMYMDMNTDMYMDMDMYMDNGEGGVRRCIYKIYYKVRSYSVCVFEV